MPLQTKIMVGLLLLVVALVAVPAMACETPPTCPPGEVWGQTDQHCYQVPAVYGPWGAWHSWSNTPCQSSDICEVGYYFSHRHRVIITPAHEQCDPIFGCIAVSCPAIPCPEGQHCNGDGQCVGIDPCAGTQCGAGEECRGGECVGVSCPAIPCEAGYDCSEGVCIPQTPVFHGGYNPFTRSDVWGSSPSCSIGDPDVIIQYHTGFHLRAIFFSERALDGIQVSGISGDTGEDCQFVRSFGAGERIVDLPYVVGEGFRIQVAREEYGGLGDIPGVTYRVYDHDLGESLYSYAGGDSDLTFRLVPVEE